MSVSPVPTAISPVPTAIVVGGGPAGLMAAEVLATAGWAVTVLEHMPSTGRKLLLAGRGGLNITHGEPSDALLTRYGPSAAMLEPALRAFGANELRAWCAGLGEPTFVGSSGRVFPASFRATPLLRAWLARLASLGVVVETRRRLVDLPAPGAVECATPDRVERRTADVVVLALGGASWPRVGSDGGWVETLRDREVVVAAMRPANCGLRAAWRPEFVARHEGLPVKDVRVWLEGPVDDATDGATDDATDGAERATTDARHVVRGDLVITRSGIEGGPVYALAAAARDTIDRVGECTLRFDLRPDRTVAQLADRLGRARSGDSVSTVLRRSAGLTPVAAALVRELAGRRLPTEPLGLAHLLKALPFTTRATMPIDRAISSAGGIAWSEIDERFMLRRLPGVFVAGEMIDWEAPTGGYLLQATFSTAVAAARGAMSWHHAAAGHRGV